MNFLYFPKSAIQLSYKKNSNPFQPFYSSCKSRTKTTCTSTKDNSSVESPRRLSILQPLPDPADLVTAFKTLNCKVCSACTSPDCGSCGHCLDKKKFGGPNVSSCCLIFDYLLNICQIESYIFVIIIN